MTTIRPDIIVLSEHEESKEIDPPLSEQEILIVQRHFKGKIDIIPKLNGKHSIKSYEYVGYIILPKHTINIRPKIPGINFINMVRYALNIPEVDLKQDYIAEEAKNFYEILVLFLLKNVEFILKRGLYHNFLEYQENVNYVRGKVLFKEHIMANSGRSDKVFCQFSELTADVLENRIIKYTLFHLLHIADFLDHKINNLLAAVYRRFDQVDLVPTTTDIFEFINYTPLNEHYKPVLSLCQLLLQDSSVNIERIGEKISLSFLIDMNKLFEDFVGNLLLIRFGDDVVRLQKKSYPEVKGRKLRVIPDIILSYKGSLSVVVDTKYRELTSKPEESEVAQMVLYSLSTGVKRCILVYTGKDAIYGYQLKEQINLETLSLDLNTSSKMEFEKRCSDFVTKIGVILS